MNIQTIGRKVNLKDSFTQRVENRLAKMDKFFSDDATAVVSVIVEKNRQTVELTVRDNGLVVRSEQTAEGMEQAFDEAADVVTKQIIKHRKKISDKYKKGADEKLSIAPIDEEDTKKIVKEKVFFVAPASAEEAVMQMDLLGHNFYLFRNVDTGEINVVYKRKDGNYGMLIPE